jgi:Flp pilus assembly protein TadD
VPRFSTSSWRKLGYGAAAAASLLALCSCSSFDASKPPDTSSTEPSANPTVQDPGEVKYYPSHEPLRLAIEHFGQGHYGLAQQYFKDAAERAPKDVTAWVGLAASYDRLGRFDLADRAYRSAIRLKGETTDILNNEGYSYMLRGDLVKARAKFQAAARRDPDNPTIANNLRLLSESSKYIVRAEQ